MESRDCFKELPWFYKNLMHYVHVFTVPVYIAVLAVLYRETSKAFKTYKYYIMIHVFINFTSEMNCCYLLLPDTILPHPLLKMSGLMAQWGFSGILLFYIQAQFVIWTAGSISEMFYFRLKICIFNHDKHSFFKFLKILAYLFRFSMFLHPVIVAATLQLSLVEEQEGRMKLWLSNTTAIPVEVTCYSVMLAIPDSIVIWILIPVYFFMMITSCVIAGFSVGYIFRFIRKNKVMSKQTEMLQRMLIYSLTIQAVIHSTMIVCPIIYLFIGFFFKLTIDSVAKVFILIFAYHGFVSTCGMVIFTKPLRDKLLPFFKYIKVGQSAQISTARISTTVAGPPN